MSGKTGQRSTARKPENVRSKRAKTDGAFGKETDEQVVSGDANRNVDKGARKVRTGEAGSGA